MFRDRPNRREEGGVDLIVPLGGEAGAEEVEWVCSCGGEAACDGAGGE